MRAILFFDVPMDTIKQKKEYRHFLKLLKASGFYRLQKSVYCKMSIDIQNTNSTIKYLKRKVPKEGVVSVLIVTEKQFGEMIYLLGDHHSDIIDTDERLIEL